MNLFETVKSAVTVKQAAHYYGLQICRNDMVCCPFHQDRHPSMKLNEDYYFCFGCGASGDVIGFTAKLFGLTKYEAAKKLEKDFGIAPDDPPAAVALSKERRRVIRAFREDEMYCHRVICDYLHLLENWEKEYAPGAPALPMGLERKGRQSYQGDQYVLFSPFTFLWRKHESTVRDLTIRKV